VNQAKYVVGGQVVDVEPVENGLPRRLRCDDPLPAETIEAELDAPRRVSGDECMDLATSEGSICSGKDLQDPPI